ncbi:MAG: hypothetical protein EOP48_31900 [Sphingobacteriales bacterium]|nr:MAG: hypothetical protein EOP48_31900 [Sphingobacteriales bacterium]
MLNKVSFFALVVILAGACSESKFKGEPTTAAPVPKVIPKVADSTVETGEIKPTETEPETVVEEKVLKDKCSGTGVKVLEQKLTFPEVRGCGFEENNITPFNEGITAINTTTAALNLPNGEVCDVDFQSDSDIKFIYDDILLFSLDNNLLFSSTDTLIPLLTKSEKFYTWDKAKIVTDFKGMTKEEGKKHTIQFDGKAICLTGATCLIPKTDTLGQLSLNFPFESIASLIQMYKGKSSVPLNLSVTGDDDEKDCSHSTLSLNVKIKYVP